MLRITPTRRVNVAFRRLVETPRKHKRYPVRQEPLRLSSIPPLGPPEKARRGEDRLVLEGVSASYAARRGSDPRAAAEERLHRVDLSLRAGELLCVLGPNGAGKSTLVRVASALLPPTAGQETLHGEPLAGRAPGEVARVLAVVEQSQEVAMGFTVREVVAMGRAPHQGAWMRASSADEEAVERAIARCDLRELADRPASALSGGEQKRVAIARALAQEPKVLLLDEPGAFLDVRHQLDLYELLASEVEDGGLACLVVMHDLNVAAHFADRVALVKGGRVVAVGTIEEVMTWRALKETFDADLYVGVNELTGTRFFLPMRVRGS